MKTLISWIATRNDFFETNAGGESIISAGFNLEGPHYNLYKNFLDFDRHYVFCTSNFYNSNKETSSKVDFFINNLNEDFKRKEGTVLKLIHIDDPTSVWKIKNKIDDFIIQKDLNNKKKEEVEIFINPGTPAMQTVWYFIGNENRSIKLFKVQEARFTENKLKPEKIDISFSQSQLADVTNIIENTKRKKHSKGLFITPSLKNVFEKAKLVAENNSTTVLIQGETGTGKEVLAKYIHSNSHRKNYKMIALNCAAYTEELLESRLFGYEKGAFTGARDKTKGAFEEAQNSTIFLDEIGDISPKMQVTLLRVLQEKKISKIGSTKEINLDIRIISATNKDLWKLCKQGKFRFDLFYRLAIVELKLPIFYDLSKKERKDWINHFLERGNVKMDKAHLNISKDALSVLLKHTFPGNLRELENLIENFYVFATKEIQVSDIPNRIISPDVDFSLKLEDVVCRHVLKVYNNTKQNIAETARTLEVTETTVRNKLKKLTS